MPTKKIQYNDRAANLEKDGNARATLGETFASKGYATGMANFQRADSKLPSSTLKVDVRFPDNLKDLAEEARWDVTPTIEVSDNAAAELDRYANEFEKELTKSDDANAKFLTSGGTVSHLVIFLKARVLFPLSFRSPLPEHGKCCVGAPIPRPRHLQYQPAYES